MFGLVATISQKCQWQLVITTQLATRLQFRSLSQFRAHFFEVLIVV